MMVRIRVAPIERNRSEGVFTNMLEGITFISRNGLFAFLIGMSYIFLLPIFAKDILDVGPQGLGMMQAVPGVGALAMTFVAAALGNTRWKGPLLIGSAAAFGLLLVAFAYSTSYLLSLGILLLAGSCSTLYMVLVMTTLQGSVPDELRGRVMGIYGMTWSLLPLGAVQAGFIADLVSAEFAVALGGAAVAAFAVGVAAASRRIRRLGAAEPSAAL